MSDQRIIPSTVTKPIQLLAAWLVGLIAINGSFLAAASHITHPDWAPGVLVIAAVVDVPIFLACLFMLQTKFRPEMQEDEFYWKYLEKRYSVETAKTELIEVTAPANAARIGEGLKIPKIGVRQPSLSAERTELQINDLLPSYPELRRAIAEEGYEISETFGSTSVGKDVPSPFIISIADRADIKTFQKVMRLAISRGLEGVAYAADPEWPNRIYIGAYSYKTNPYVPINAETTLQLLSDDLNWDTLFRILRGANLHPADSAARATR